MWKIVKTSLRALTVVGAAVVLCFAAHTTDLINSIATVPPAWAEEDEGAATPAEDIREAPVVAPRADELLREMGDYLKTAKEFSFHTENTFDDVLPSGQKLQYAASINVAMRRPNRLHAEYHGDLGDRRFWYDGHSITLLSEEDNVYATEPAPEQIDATLDHLMEDYGFSMPLADLVFSDPYAILIENVKFGLYVTAVHRGAFGLGLHHTTAGFSVHG
jgi:hypothetical protein